MKIIVDKLPENPLECIFSRINTGTRRCAHNAKICLLTRDEECPFLAEKFPVSPTAIQFELPEDVEPAPEPKKRVTKKVAAKKVSE